MKRGTKIIYWKKSPSGIPSLFCGLTVMRSWRMPVQNRFAPQSRKARPPRPGTCALLTCGTGLTRSAWMACSETFGGLLCSVFAARRSRRSEEHTSELQSRQYLVCRLLLEKKKTMKITEGGGSSGDGAGELAIAAKTGMLLQRDVLRV